MTAETRAGEAPRGPTRWIARATALFSVLALFLLSRPYFGIRHDARIYVGRAEADLGRNGMAESLMFAHDGQSKFSVFGALFRPLVEHLGSPQAALVATIAGLTFWLAAASVLVSRICRGAAFWAGVVAIAVLPAFYAGVLAFGEPFITPRLFAEGLVCLALACVLERRWIAGGAILLLAAALHPIMTAPGVAVFGIMLVLQDRRWLIPAALGGGAVLAAAFSGLPLIERLVAPMDAAWTQMLQQRSTYLFPSLWSEDSWSMLIRQSLTLVISAGFLSRRSRILVHVTVAVGVAGVFASMAASTVLTVQMQLWRGQWIVALLATALLPFTIAQLWRAGSEGRVAAALLAVAWGAGAPPVVGALAAGLALAVRFVLQTGKLSPLAWRIAWALAAVMLARSALISAAAAVVNSQAAAHSGVITRMLYSESLAVVALTAAVVAILQFERVKRIASRPSATALAALLLVVSAAAWDAQAEWTRARDSSSDAAALRAQLPPGEIFWVGNDGRSGPWTDRPEWWSINEGASSVFDRALAMEWQRRHEILVRAGLTPRKIEMIEVRSKVRPPSLTAASLAIVCASPRGPSAIIAPLQRTAQEIRPWASGEWRAPASPPDQPQDSQFLIFTCGAVSSRPGQT